MPLIDKITQRETIGMSIQYFEKIVGPAKIIGPQPLERTYEIDGCKIKTTLNNEEQKSILALNISITPQCNAKFGNFISETSKDTPLNTLTFGALEKLLDSPTEYYADCLIGCGNAYDPSVYLYWQGSHAQGFLEVIAAVTLTEDDALNAAGNWAKAMTKFEGENWLVDAEFNCQPEKYSNIARNIFSDVKITSITIGYSVNEFVCKNQTTHSQQ